MKISVVIPAYNESRYITNCLDSLTKQDEKPLEIIVVDNNCTDNTVSIAKKYNVRIVKETRQGMIFARNSGFDAAQGDIIARCDADVVLPTDWISKINQAFNSNRINALTGPVTYRDWAIANLPAYAELYLKTMATLQNGKNTLVGPNMIITKKIWQKVKSKVCLDESLVHEDIDLAIHINEAGGQIMVDNNLVVSSSARRIKNHPFSFFVEYPIRVVKTLQTHKS